MGRVAPSFKARAGGLHRLLERLRREEPAVYRHGLRVAAYVEAVGRRLDLGPKELFFWRMGALLHDVGKLLVPRRLLHAPRELCTDECAVLRFHVQAGRLLIERYLPPLKARPLVPFVYLHHERYDGRGYPLGLAGSAIPLGVAVLSVADAYVAMREPRPYRIAKTHFQAVAELARGSGSQFHPEAVLLLLAVLGERTPSLPPPALVSPR